MSEFLTAHIIREKTDLAPLANLPTSIGFCVYHQRSLNLWWLDPFRAASPSGYSFQTPLPGDEIPRELPQELMVLRRLYDQLARREIADGFKRSYVNACMLISRLIQTPVFSFASDDDELDFTCSASAGRLMRLRCRCADLLVTYTSQGLEIAPLLPEFAEDAEDLTDVKKLKAALPDARFLPRQTPWVNELHGVATEELRGFTNLQIPNVGDFDNESDWVLQISR